MIGYRLSGIVDARFLERKDTITAEGLLRNEEYSTRLQSCKVLVGLAIMSGLDNECGWVWGDETPRMPYGWVGVSVHGPDRDQIGTNFLVFILLFRFSSIH